MKSKITTLAASLSLLRLAQPLLLGAFGFATAASTAVVLLQGAAQAQSAISFYNQGIDKLRSRNYQGAIIDFSKAIKINPKFNEAYFNRGDMKVRLKDYQGAIDDFSKAIELDPQNAMAYFNRGSVKGMTKDYQGLCADYKKAASLGNPGERQFINRNYAVKCRNHGTAVAHDAVVFIKSGIAKMKSNNYQGAIADFSKAIELAPQDGDIYHNRATAKGLSKDYQGSCDDYKKAASLGSQAAIQFLNGGGAWCRNRR